MNVVVLTGRLVKAPDFKVAQNGTEICNFTIANQTGFGDKEKTNFIDATCFKSSAKFVSSYCMQGDLMLIEGELTQDRWEKDGKKNSRMKVIANRVEKMRSKGDGKQSNRSDSIPTPSDSDFIPPSFDEAFDGQF